MLTQAHLTDPAVRHPVTYTGPVANPFPRLLAGEGLAADDAEHRFERLVLGKLEAAEIAGMLKRRPC